MTATSGAPIGSLPRKFVAGDVLQIITGQRRRRRNESGDAPRAGPEATQADLLPEHQPSQQQGERQEEQYAVGAAMQLHLGSVRHRRASCGGNGEPPLPLGDVDGNCRFDLNDVVALQAYVAGQLGSPQV